MVGEMTLTKRTYPGLVVSAGRPEKYERAHIRYTDRAGKRRTQKIPPDLAGDALHRWLLRKSAELMLQRARSEPPPGAVMSLELAVEKYLAERHRLRASTRTQYRYTLQKLVAWMGGKPVTQARLRGWRAALDRPGAAAASVNRDLAHASAFLHHARKAGDVMLTRDQIADGLERLPGDHEKLTPLSLAEVRTLVEALDRAVAGHSPSSSIPGQDRTAARYRAFVLTVLLTGMRLGECLNLDPSRVDLESKRIVLRRIDTKTKRGRTIDLSVSPSVCLLLKDALPWGLTADQVRSWRTKRHPQFTFKRMRVTCGTYLTCAPGIYGGASAYMSAARLGHSVAIAEKHYVGVVQVPATARTLEEALGLDDHQ